MFGDSMTSENMNNNDNPKGGSSTPSYLRHFERVVEAFGYWPGFHDSPVLRFRSDDDRIELEVEAWEMTSDIDERGHFKLAKRHEIGFAFQDIVAKDHDQFAAENILFELTFSSHEEWRSQGYFSVGLESAVGSEFCGRFSAREGKVTFVRPSR